MTRPAYRTGVINFRYKSNKITYLMCIIKTFHITNISYISKGCYWSYSRNSHYFLYFFIIFNFCIYFLQKLFYLFFKKIQSFYKSFSFFFFISLEQRKNIVSILFTTHVFSDKLCVSVMLKDCMQFVYLFCSLAFKRAIFT